MDLGCDDNYKTPDVMQIGNLHKKRYETICLNGGQVMHLKYL